MKLTCRIIELRMWMKRRVKKSAACRIQFKTCIIKWNRNGSADLWKKPASNELRPPAELDQDWELWIGMWVVFISSSTEFIYRCCSVCSSLAHTTRQPCQQKLQFFLYSSSLAISAANHLVLCCHTWTLH